MSERSHFLRYCESNKMPKNVQPLIKAFLGVYELTCSSWLGGIRIALWKCGRVLKCISITYYTCTGTTTSTTFPLSGCRRSFCNGLRAFSIVYFSLLAPSRCVLRSTGRLQCYFSLSSHFTQNTITPLRRLPGRYPTRFYVSLNIVYYRHLPCRRSAHGRHAFVFLWENSSKIFVADSSPPASFSF
jgi:hypothetical protein